MGGGEQFMLSNKVLYIKGDIGGGIPSQDGDPVLEIWVLNSVLVH